MVPSCTQAVQRGLQILLPRLLRDSGQVTELCQPCTGARWGTSPQPVGQGTERCESACVDNSRITVMGWKTPAINPALTACAVHGQSHTLGQEVSFYPAGTEKASPFSGWFVGGCAPGMEEAVEQALFVQAQG